jgi:hypothetical protein
MMEISLDNLADPERDAEGRLMAGEIVNMEKLAEAQEAADTAMEAAMLAAEVVRAADPDAKPVWLTDQRINTTLRIEPALLRELKFAAVEDGRKVNDLILDGVHHILSLRQKA